MAQWAVANRSAMVKLVCQAFGISQTCYRYKAKLDADQREQAKLMGLDLSPVSLQQLVVRSALSGTTAQRTEERTEARK